MNYQADQIRQRHELLEENILKQVDKSFILCIDPETKLPFMINMGLKMADGGEAMKGFSMLPESVQEKMNSVKAKKYNKGGPVKKMGGGMMKYKKGGSVSKSKKPRGTGIAIKGTKFKGVF